MDFNQWLRDVRGINIYTYLAMGSADQNELYEEYQEWKKENSI